MSLSSNYVFNHFTVHTKQDDHASKTQRVTELGVKENVKSFREKEKHNKRIGSVMVFVSKKINSKGQEKTTRHVS